MTEPTGSMDCPYFTASICRSCSLLDQSYAATLDGKQQLLAEMFPEVLLHPIAPSSAVSGSRIRARVAVFGSADAPQFGFLNEQRQIVAVDQRPLHDPAINRFLTQLQPLISQYRLTPYRMDDDRGELKFLVLTWSPTHQQLMVQFVLRSKEAVDRIRTMWRDHRETTLSNVAVLSVNLQPVRSSALNGREEINVSEQRRLTLRYGEMSVLYGPQSFVQTNFGVAEQLYRTAAAIVRQSDPIRLVDLYCGTGAFSLTAAGPNTRVFGFDVAQDSIDCANESAAVNGRSDCRYAAHQPGTINLPDDHPLRSAPTAHGGSDAAICNPPRAGMDESARQFVRQLKPRQLLYSSCNPESLRRDLDLLSGEFQLNELHPFDMFPMTTHLEVLAVLESRS